MATPKKTVAAAKAPKVIAPKKGVVGAASVGDAAAGEPAPGIVYSKEDKAVIKKLVAGGVELSGKETTEELDTLRLELEANSTEDAGEAEEVDGVPNSLPVRTEDFDLAGKKIKLPIFFVATVKGGKQALYSYTGQRASPAYGTDDTVDPNDTSSEKGLKYIAKACAKFNAMRRKGVLPGETR